MISYRTVPAPSEAHNVQLCTNWHRSTLLFYCLLFSIYTTTKLHLVYNYSLFSSLLLILLLKLHILFCTFASSMILLYSIPFLVTACQFLILFIFISSSAFSGRFFHGLPLFLLPSIPTITICFGILSLLILPTCPRSFLCAVYSICYCHIILRSV